MNNMDKMMQTLSGKLGVSTKTLQNAMQSGDISTLLTSMKADDAKKLGALLQNKEMMEKLMKSPEAKQMMKNMK